MLLIDMAGRPTLCAEICQEGLKIQQQIRETLLWRKHSLFLSYTRTMKWAVWHAETLA